MNLHNTASHRSSLQFQRNSQDFQGQTVQWRPLDTQQLIKNESSEVVRVVEDSIKTPTQNSKKVYKQSGVFKLDNGTEKNQSLMMIQSSQLFKKGVNPLRDSLKSLQSGVTPLLALKKQPDATADVPFDR